MNNPIEELVQQVESLALDIVLLDPEDIPGLGKVIRVLEEMDVFLGEINEDSLVSLARAMKGYIEMVILGDKSDFGPFETGIVKLQDICRCLINETEFNKDVSSLLENLCSKEISTLSSSPIDGGVDPVQSGDEKKKNPPNLIEEDMEIIADFVAESLENLETVEVKLMDLEQDPSNVETINTIFRPFHTVKGVSGFLNFNKINRLAHISENLLDKARNGEHVIDGITVDVILDSVDILKGMIENVKASLDTGVPSEGDQDIGDIIDRIDYMINMTKDDGAMPLGDIMVAKGLVSMEDVGDALDVQKENDKKIGEILVENEKVKACEVVSALRTQKKTGRPASLHVKVDIVKLDSVVDMVGELVIAQSMLRQHELVKKENDRTLDYIINQVEQITSGLQKTAMSLRMVPIKNTFQKMPRLVRDLSKKAGKEVRLVMSGEDTETDRNMVEEIYEPMVHMIRNSVDHGLEQPDEREKAGKSREGTIYLSAYHKGGNIVIEIRDDGRGLNREKILKKAISSGLVKETEKLSESEIDSLIFHPGLSTAEKISAVSGRGVGMDVVKNNIKKLNGGAEVQSTPGKGTTVFLCLPLTLAVVDGMIVKVCGERYIVPVLAIQESFRPEKAKCFTVRGEGEMIMFRNNMVPLTRLDKLFSLNGGSSLSGNGNEPWERLVVVVENSGRRRCILVDELLGQEEVVIKSLGEGLKGIKGVAGGAIMGDGRVGLILDVAGMFDIAEEAV